MGHVIITFEVFERQRLLMCRLPACPLLQELGEAEIDEIARRFKSNLPHAAKKLQEEYTK